MLNGANRLIVFVILITSFLLNTSYAQLVTNGSFENSDIGAVDTTDVQGWVLELLDGSAAQFSIDSTESIEGSNSLKTIVDTLGTNSWSIQAVIDSIPVTNGTTYNFTIWAKAEKAGTEISITVGNYDYSEYGALRPVTLSTEWKKYTLKFTVDDNKEYIRAPIHYNNSVNIGNAIYIDNAKIEDANKGKKPIVVEAEGGVLGSNFSVLEDGEVTYVTAVSNYSGLSAPGDTSRMSTFEITFEDSGFYSLFARVRVGAGGFDDDSFFYARGFGEKSDTASADWVFINGLGSAGFSDSAMVVDGVGSVGNGTWKWINVTKNTYSGVPGDTFYVSQDSLTQVFQIAHREDGLDIDKIAFGKTSLFYTVNILDKELFGLTELPIIDDRPVWEGPALATGDVKFLGNAGDNPNDTYINYWNQITPGNAGKWASIASSSDTSQWNWSSLDRVYNFAKDNNIPFKNHTLIWGNQQPSWISNADLDSTQQYEYIETWIKMVGERYPDMDMIDVVNEPLANHNPPDGKNGRANYKNALGGNGATGWDWVIKSFELARQYMPNTELILNDYGIINDDNSTTNYLKIINVLNARGLIDGIGVQAHRFSLEGAYLPTVKSNLDRLAATDLPIYVSELDLGNLGNFGVPNDNKQLELYQNIFPILWEHPGVKGITLWGYIEDEMWQSSCCLVRATGSARPALLWLAEYVKNNPTGISESASTEVPTSFKLEQNYPNPFNPVTNIQYSIVSQTKVTLSVFDILGRRVQTLVNEIQSPGQYSVAFNAQDISSGIYFYQLSADGFTSIKKLTVLK